MDQAELDSLIATEQEYIPGPATVTTDLIRAAFRAGHAAGYWAGNKHGWDAGVRRHQTDGHWGYEAGKLASAVIATGGLKP